MLNKKESKGFIWRNNPCGTRTKKHIFECKDCKTDIFIANSQLKISTGYCSTCSHKDNNKNPQMRSLKMFNEKGEKYCKCCNRFLELSKFTKTEIPRKIKIGTKVRHSTICNRCYAVSKFGINALQYEEMLEKQNYKCLICKNQESINRHLAVDHNHKTGQIRGLLCKNCNTSIGAFKEDIEILQNAIDYLKLYEVKT